MAGFVERLFDAFPELETTRLYENFAESFYRPDALPESKASVLEHVSSGASDIEIGVFDLSGRRIRRIVPGASAGRITADWDLRDEAGRRIAEGVYFVSARIGTTRHVRRLPVVK